jgi:hypothetical protein
MQLMEFELATKDDATDGVRVAESDEKATGIRRFHVAIMILVFACFDKILISSQEPYV